MAIVPVGADGNIHLYNAYGNTHLIVDVLGYLYRGADAATTTGRVVPLDAPFRVFDTRQPEFGAAPLGFGTSESWSFADFTDSVQPRWCATRRADGVHRQPHRHGAHPAAGLQPARHHLHDDVSGRTATPPESSNINLVEGQTVPNMSLLRYGTARRRRQRDQGVQLQRVGALPARRVRRHPRLVCSASRRVSSRQSRSAERPAVDRSSPEPLSDGRLRAPNRRADSIGA